MERNTTTSYYAVITNANGNPDATLIGAWVPAGTYTSTLGAFVALSGYVDETTTAITAQLASSIGGNLFMSASNNYQLGTNGMVFGEISTDNMTNYIPGESYLSSKTSLTSTQLDTIEYVADALALCVQTQNQCSNLFADSENGSGVQPSDTLQAAINLALDIEYTTGYNSLLGLSSAQTNLNNMLSFTNGLMSSSLPYDFASGSQITGYGSLNFGNLII